MFLADYHVHTQFSNDTRTSMRQMAHAAVKHGITQMCFTDHMDDCCAVDPDPRQRGTTAQWPSVLREFAAVKEEFEGVLDLRVGMELSGLNRMPELAKKIADEVPCDFILGSLHNTRDTLDFFYYKFSSQEECERIAKDYMAENLEIAKQGGFDCMAHIGYFNKCSARMGFVTPLMSFEEELREIFKALISNGLGIEVNTSGLVNPMGEAIPNLEAVKIYRELGGEIITVGTDSHGTFFYPSGIKDGYELIKTAGFKYVTTFKDRKPEFVKIV